MIKPEAVAAGLQGQIIDLLLRNRFRISRLKQFRFDVATAERFYAEHRGKEFYEPLIAFITSGEVIGLQLEQANAVAGLRELVGVTDPAEARPGTLRYMFGTSGRANAVHASDTAAAAEKELAIVFGAD